MSVVIGAPTAEFETKLPLLIIGAGAAGLTFPQVRAIVQEIFTALLFAAKPRYMHWMEQAKRELQLRI